MGALNPLAGFACPQSAISCDTSPNPPDNPDNEDMSCCVPRHGLLVLAVQWLPGYCKGNRGTDSCTHDILDRLPTDEWTIHGLWPDTCDGYQVSECDRKRLYNDTKKKIADTNIMQNMTRYCSNECTDNVYDALKRANIVPSETAMYSSENIKKAIVTAFGPLSIGLRCKGHLLSEIRLALVGSAAGVAVNGNLYLPGNCPRYGITYQPGHQHFKKLVKQDVDFEDILLRD
ncbi:ribonuclease T2-like [Chytridiales sp. JEL 0842]|nr:ribonuclease T2-like [Chytridiales sp. JEL 0842]